MTLFFLLIVVFIPFSYGCVSGTSEKNTPELPPSYSLILQKRNISIYGGSGKSPESAIIIVGADNALEGSRAECLYLEKKYPGFVPGKNQLLKYKDRFLDVWEIYFENKTERIYFDISSFIGKR